MKRRPTTSTSSPFNDIDSTGADQIGTLAHELEAKGVITGFAEVKSSLREAKRRSGLD